MVALISSMSSPAPAPGDDPALRRAIKCGFVTLPIGIHRAYWAWCSGVRRPYVSIEVAKSNRVRLCMGTCGWNLSAGRRRHLMRLACCPTGNCGGYLVDDRNHGDFVFYGVPGDRAETIAFSCWEAGLDSRPSGRGEDEECSGA